MLSGRFLTLRAQPYNNDLLIEALSKEGEKITLNAKNGLISKKRFAGGVLEPLKFVEFFYRQSKSGFNYIEEVRVIDDFMSLRESYEKLEIGFYFLKLISKGTHPGLLDNQALFDLLGNSLRALVSSRKPLLLKLQFEMKFLHALGFLEVNNDNQDFLSLGVAKHNDLLLTDDEVDYLAQANKLRLRQAIDELAENL